MTTRATVTINGPADRDQISRWAQKVEVGTIVEFRKKTRSNEQNAKLHAMLSEVAVQVVWYGAKLNIEDWKNMFSASMRKAQVVPGIDPGTVVPLGIHTSTMTVDEMSNMIEAIYAFGADPAHPVVFKEPQDNQESGSSPSSEPVNAEASPLTSAASDDAPSSPSSDAPLTMDAQELRRDLMDFARKAFRTASDTGLSAEKRIGFLDDMIEAIKADFPRAAWGKFVSIKISAESAVRNPNDLNKRRAAVAKDFLDCRPEEIGG